MTIDLLHIDLANVRPDPSLVSADELARGATFADSADRDRYLAAHTWLRSVLAAATGSAPRSLVISTTGNGKPELPDHELHFSLAHTSDHALVALSRRDEVGVDLESLHQQPFSQDAMDRVLTAGERSWLANQPDQHRAFLQLWVRKEAVAKGARHGYHPTFADIDVAGSSPVLCGQHIVADLDIGAGYVAAAATAMKSARPAAAIHGSGVPA